jgi:hypothetical protein
VTPETVDLILKLLFIGPMALAIGVAVGAWILAMAGVIGE